MKNIRLIIYIVIMLFIESCSIRSSQLSALISFFDQPISDISSKGWSVNYSGYNATVFAVSIQDGILFSNREGDQILFDGWSIRVVNGLGDENFNINIDDVNGLRTFRQGSRVLAVHNCDNWHREDRYKLTRFYQQCADGLEYSNRILVLEDGSISLIRQIIDERYTPLTLTKLK